MILHLWNLLPCKISIIRILESSLKKTLLCVKKKGEKLSCIISRVNTRHLMMINCHLIWSLYSRNILCVLDKWFSNSLIKCINILHCVISYFRIYAKCACSSGNISRTNYFLSLGALSRTPAHIHYPLSYSLDEVARNDSPCLTWVSSHVPRAEQGRVFTPTLLRESEREREKGDW